MANWKKTVLLILSAFVCIFGGVFMFKWCNLEVSHMEASDETNGYINSFIYNEDIYYSLNDIRYKTDIYDGVFSSDSPDIDPYILLKRTNDIKYASWGDRFIDIITGSRLYTYENDPQSNIFDLKGGFPGPDSWTYVKKGYVFPTIQTAEVAKIYITIQSSENDLSYYQVSDSDVLLDASVYDNIIACVEEHKDFSPFLPQEDWAMLYVVYTDSPCGEMIAINTESGLEWCEGGTP